MELSEIFCGSPQVITVRFDSGANIVAEGISASAMAEPLEKEESSEDTSESETIGSSLSAAKYDVSISTSGTSSSRVASPPPEPNVRGS